MDPLSFWGGVDCATPANSELGAPVCEVFGQRVAEAHTLSLHWEGSWKLGSRPDR